jgi:hypothetical protein
MDADALLFRPPAALVAINLLPMALPDAWTMDAEPRATVSALYAELKAKRGRPWPPKAFLDSLNSAFDFFFLSDPIRNFGTSCVYHRKRQSTTQKVLNRLLALVNKRRIQIKRLLKSVDVNDNLFPRIDIDEHFGNAAEIAKIVRAAWKIPPGPLPNLTSAIEDAGGLVIRCEFGTNKVDAFSQWLPDMPPLFFVNMTIPADRVRFSLA